MAIQDIYPTALRLLGRPVLVVGGGCLLYTSPSPRD